MHKGYLELSRRAFPRTSDPRFYFASASHRQAIAAIGCGLARNRGAVIVSGPGGSGKTMLAAYLRAHLDPQRIAVLALAHAARWPADLEPAVRQAALAGRRALVLIDEAERCSSATLARLCRLGLAEDRHGPPPQVVLLARSEKLAVQVASIGIEVLVSKRLAPLEAGETVAYVEHRLSLAGWAGDPDFWAGVRAAIVASAERFPSQLDRIVRRLLLLAARKGFPSLSPGLFHRGSSSSAAPATADLDQRLRRPRAPEQGGDRRAAA